MNEQIKKDRNYISRMLKLLEGSNLTIAHNILAAQKRVTQYEERQRAAKIVENLIHKEPLGITRADDGLISWKTMNNAIESHLKEILDNN